MSAPVAEVNIVCIDDPLDAQALRAALESWGARVAMRWVGQAKDLVRILGGEEDLSRVVVLMCHGDDGGLVLPPLHPSVEEGQPYHGALSPADLREFLKLPGRLVVNAGCSLGTPEFAGAFLDAGCSSYVGARGAPDGSASLFYVLHLLYGLVCRKQPVKEAHAAARSHDDETGMYELYEAGTPGADPPAPPPA